MTHMKAYIMKVAKRLALCLDTESRTSTVALTIVREGANRNRNRRI
jgi:hypothetical protein